MIISEKAFKSAQSRGHKATRKINGKSRNGWKAGKSFFFKSGPTRQKVPLVNKTNPSAACKADVKRAVRKAGKTAARKTKAGVKKVARKAAKKIYEKGAAYLMKRNPKGYNIYLSNAKGTARRKMGYVLTKGDAKKWLKQQGLTKAIIV